MPSNPAFFSTRLPWQSPTNALTRRCQALRQAGVHLHDMTVSNPTTVGLPLPTAAILAPLSDPRALVYEPSPRGPADSRGAVAGYYRDLGASVDAEQVVLTASTSEGYAHLFRLLADPGDEILMPRPSYPLFDFLAGLESVELMPYPLAYDVNWHIDLPALERAITPRTRALILVNPNNPTGSYLKAHEYQRLREICATHHLALIVDEVFTDYPLAAPADAVRTLAGESEILTFVLSGLSKVCALPQMKIGWICVAGPVELREAALERLELIADSFLSPSTPSLLALPAWLELRPQLQQPIHERIRRNDRLLREMLRGSVAQPLVAEGGWYAIIRLPALYTDEAWALSMVDLHQTLFHPGYWYDLGRHVCLVCSLLTPCEIFHHGISCLSERINLLHSS